MPVGSIPSPSFNGIHVGPFDIRLYVLRYALAVLTAVAVTTPGLRLNAAAH